MLYGNSALMDGIEKVIYVVFKLVEVRGPWEIESFFCRPSRGGRTSILSKLSSRGIPDHERIHYRK